jgi:hypothetical protein
MAARDLVFGVGDRVKTWGRFVGRPDGEWLDLARVHDLIRREPGWKSARSVRLVGVDTEAVAATLDQGMGYLSVLGIWLDEAIEVELVSAHRPARESRQPRTDPPCPPPPGGWRHDLVSFDLDRRELESSGAIVHVAIFHPAADSEVLVVAASDVDEAIRQLSPKLPRQLCVVPSRFSRAQIDEVYDVLHAHWQEWRLESFGTGSDDQAQVYIPVMMFRVTAGLADWADALPDGLVRLEPTLTPARR